MLFSSWQFIFLFLPVTLLVFFLIPTQFRTTRKVWLTLASLFFYAYWKVTYLPLLIFSILFNYMIAESIIRYRRVSPGRMILIIGVSVNLLLLGYFKYTNFLLSFFGRISDHDFPKLDIILPLAISFFTFTQIAYIVDVYRDETRHYGFIDYVLFVVFCPHLIAGPIVRHWEIIPQYADKDLKASRADFATGTSLFLMGLYKKVLIADTVAIYADKMYTAAGNGAAVTCFDSWFGTLAFALQIYFDFSGYSDMAIGLARLFGVKFPANFNSPYRAESVADFWYRWHMTLSRFLREYVYFPLGGSRVSKWRHIFNVMITMLLSGLWHGAGWTFIIWGGIHGVYVVIVHLWQQFKKQRNIVLNHRGFRMASITLTFLAVLVAWVFFRAPNFATAERVLRGMAGLNGLTAPERVLDVKFGFGEAIRALGFKIVPTTLDIGSYREQVRVALLLLFAAWLVPNTQQLLERYDPTLEKAPVTRLQLSINGRLGVAFGILFFFVLRTYFAAAPSPFLYFNF